MAPHHRCNQVHLYNMEEVMSSVAECGMSSLRQVGDLWHCYRLSHQPHNDLRRQRHKVLNVDDTIPLGQVDRALDQVRLRYSAIPKQGPMQFLESKYFVLLP